MTNTDYLSQVDLIQHHQTGTPVVVNQTPEVFDGVGQRMLGNDECSRLSVALRENKPQKGRQRFHTNSVQFTV